MHYILYRTQNIINGKIYIGVHRTDNLDDGYLGSGKNLKLAIAKYGRENFQRTVIETFENQDDLLAAERAVVTEDFCLRRDTYNQELGGSGGKVWTKELRQRMSESQKLRFASGDRPWNIGVTGYFSQSPEFCKAMSDRMSGDKNPMYGVAVTTLMSPEKIENWKKNISLGNTGKKKSNTKKYSTYASSRFWIVNQNGKIEHCLSGDDPRLLSGEYRRGKKWK